MPKLKKRNYQDFLDEHRLHCKVINDDVILFRRHNRLYRLSNLTNNRIPGKLFVLINANTTTGDFDVADRVNLLAPRSRTRTAKLFAELWEFNSHQEIAQDLSIILELLNELGLTEVIAPADPADAPRQFGKPWSSKTNSKRHKLGSLAGV